MGRDSIIMRSANPVPDDGLAFARYLDEAAEGFFRLMLGREATNIIAAAFVVPEHDLSYQNAAFAEREGTRTGTFLNSQGIWRNGVDVQLRRIDFLFFLVAVGSAIHLDRLLQLV